MTAWTCGCGTTIRHASAYIAYLNKITDHIRECIEADGGDQ